MATMDVTLRITTPPNKTIPVAADALARAYGYQAKLPDGTDNPEPRGAFIKRMIATKQQQMLQRQFVIDAEDAAREAELAKAQVTVE